MSILPAFAPDSPLASLLEQDEMYIPICDKRSCRSEESSLDTVYSTTMLKILETVTTLAVSVVSSFLLFVLLIGVRRFTMPFFRILTVVVAIIVLHSMSSIVFKLLTLWTGLLIANQDIITLVVDMLSKKLLILLIFLLALNRFVIILYPPLDNLLFARYRYIALCVSCFIVSTAETYTIIKTSNLRRVFVTEIGFVDFIDLAGPYEISCMVFLAFAFISVCLHVLIIVHLRCHNRAVHKKTAKVQQKMFREIALLTIINTMFTLLFILLYRIPSSYESRFIIISIYNILCFIPDILIPVFILIGSREVHAEISYRFLPVATIKVSKASKTLTIK